MKRYSWALALAIAIAGTASAAWAAAALGLGPYAPNGVKPLDVTLALQTRGNVWGTAAINPDGTIARCFQCSPGTTFQIATGIYQVGFGLGNITANNGFSRWVEVDTLSTGSINNVSCSTADRAGAPAAIFVDCYNGSGTPVNTSFFLFLAR